jgi:glycosyltransferase involved in cell wall biosynthesis
MAFAINGYFRTQSITGQQRYAREIATRLPNLLDQVVEYRAPRRTAGNRYLEWIDLQVGLPVRARNSVLISLTSRAPVAVQREVVTIHDLFPLSNPEWYAKGYAAFHRALLRHHLKHAAGLVVVSEPVRQLVLAYVRRSVPVVVAPNAAAPLEPAGDDGDQALAGPAQGPPSSGYFLTVGSLEPRKNLATLLRGYALLDAELRAAYPLMVVGGTSNVFQEDRNVAKWTTPGVRFLGRVPDHQLSRLYRHATTFVSVSLAEGFGVPVVEASAYGRCALVLSDIPVYRWICDGGPAAFVDPLSPTDIAQALGRSVNVPVDRAGLRHIAAKFSWDASAQAVADLAQRQI